MESRRKDEGVSSEERSGSGAETKKCCSDCKATKTPLWRSGPSGPKSLCNACGIRYRKKRPSVGGKARNSKVRDAMKVNLMADLAKEVEEQRSPRQWGEVERAALLLMAISCGAVFA